MAVMWVFTNRLYAILEAIVSLRARYRHLELLFQAPASKHEELVKDFEKLIGKLGAGALSGKILGPLVAFLTSGIKGLLVLPKDTAKYGTVKATHFLVVVDQLNQNCPIKEPVWKHTQAYFLDLIKDTLFPGGFEKARASPGSAIHDDQWQPKECSKMLLARAL